VRTIPRRYTRSNCSASSSVWAHERVTSGTGRDFAGLRRSEATGERTGTDSWSSGRQPSPAQKRSEEVEHGTELAKIAARSDHGEQLVRAVSSGRVYLDLPLLDHVHEVAAITLLEQHLAGTQSDFFGFTISIGELATSSITRSAMVVIRSSWVETSTKRPGSKFTYQAQDPFHLDVVEMGGGLVASTSGGSCTSARAMAARCC